MIRAERVRGHTFLPGLLGPDPVVVDLGAHKGEFSQALADRFGCRCYAVEAAPELAAQIHADERIEVFSLAIAGRGGPVRLVLAENPEANTIKAGHSGRVVDVPGTTLSAFLSRNALTQVDLLKMDIEGAEVDVLAATDDQVLRGVRQITIEFHDFLGIVTAAEVNALEGRLKRLGFWHIRFSWWDRTDVLFVNRRCAGLSPIGYAYLKWVVRFARGAARMVRRQLV